VDEHVHRIPRAAVLPHPLQHLPLPARSAGCNRSLAPRAVMLHRPSLHVRDTSRSPPRATATHGQSCARAHRSTSRSRPAPSGVRTTFTSPHRPLQHLQVPALRGECAVLRVARAIMAPRPPQHVQLQPAAAIHTRPALPLAPSRSLWPPPSIADPTKALSFRGTAPPPTFPRAAGCEAAAPPATASPPAPAGAPQSVGCWAPPAEPLLHQC